MIRRLSVEWPDERLFAARAGRPLRILAVSDQIDPALQRIENLHALGAVDMVVGCGDLEPDYLASLGDAFGAPLHYVRGNHDRGTGWLEHRRLLPEPLPDGKVEASEGLALGGLSWPGRASEPARRDDLGAWRQALGLVLSRLRRRAAPLLVISHVPPQGAGDDPADPYHAGFAAYRWLAERVRPPLWLHGHTTTAAAASWRVSVGETLYVNVTGAVVVDLRPRAPQGASSAG